MSKSKRTYIYSPDGSLISWHQLGPDTAKDMNEIMIEAYKANIRHLRNINKRNNEKIAELKEKIKKLEG